MHVQPAFSLEAISMNKIIHTIFCSTALALVLLAWSSSAYSAVAPVVTTLSAITEGASTPVRIAVDQSGTLYVTDPRGGGVLVYDITGKRQKTIATTARNLLGIAIAKTGEILVSQGTVVAVYSTDGAKVREFGTFGNANGIAVDDSGTIFVVDSKNNSVLAFDGTNYSAVISFGSLGSGNGQFKQPTGITFEKVSKQLAVVDTLNGRVQFFTTAGVYQKTVGSFGSGPLKFTSPQAIAFEYSASGTVLDRMYVVDAFQANVQAIDGDSSAFLSYIGNYGTRGGQMITPGDVILDPLNRLVIPNGSGSLVLFAVTKTASASSTGSAALTFTAPPTGSNPPTLVLAALNPVTGGTIPVSGTVTPGSTVTLVVQGVTTTAIADANGNWSSPITLTQAGLNAIVVTATSNGSTSSVSTYVTLDTVAPVVTSSLPQTASTTSTPIQTITGTVTDSSATTVTVLVNGVAQQPVPVNNGLFTATVLLVGGTNTVAVSTSDAAGNKSTTTSSVTYNPLAPAVAVTTPSGAVSSSASYTVTGSTPANSIVTVNGVAATVTGTQWTASIPLQSGLNSIIVRAGVAGGVESSLTSFVTYSPGQPALAVIYPPVDSATAQASPLLAGATTAGVAVTASLNGVTLPVIVTTDGIFTVTVPPFTAKGTYMVVISAIDANGKISTTNRSFVYDPTPAVMTVGNSSAAGIKVSSAVGVVIARDKNGIIVTPNNSNGTKDLDLTGATGANGAPIDMATLNIQVVTATGLSSRNGDINGDGTVDIADALLAARISLGELTATFEQLLRGDVGPLVNHTPTPDGRIQPDDVILILKKSVGIDW
jgi:hypothetical protein